MVRLKVFEVMAKWDIRTRAESARRTGLTEAKIAKIVKDDVRAIRIETIDRLCRVLECSPGDLIEYTPDPIEETEGSDGL